MQVAFPAAVEIVIANASFGGNHGAVGDKIFDAAPQAIALPTAVAGAKIITIKSGVVAIGLVSGLAFAFVPAIVVVGADEEVEFLVVIIQQEIEAVGVEAANGAVDNATEAFVDFFF